MTGFRSTTPPAPAPVSDRADGWPGSRRTDTNSTSGGPVPPARRRSVPHLVLGALLVVACAVGFAVAASNVDHRSSVLVLARPVTVGQRLTATDLRSVRMSADAGVSTIPASLLDQVTGQTVAVSLPAGALLTRDEIGQVALPAGQAVVAVAVKPGQAPPSLAAGGHVLLVVVPSNGPAAVGTTSDTAKPAGPWPGVVTAVTDLTDASGGSVVSVQVADADAQEVAALPAGQIDLVLVPGS
jgi:Flp pilus assembly protein CpaB